MFRQLLFCFVFFCALFFLIQAEEEEEKAPNLTLEQKNQILRDKLEALRQGQIVWKENLEALAEEAKQKQQRVEELEQEQEKILERLKQQEEKNFLLKEETIKILEDLNTLKTRERERVVQEKNRFHEQEEEKKKQEERSKDKDELIARFGEITNNLNKKAFDSLRELSDLVEKERRGHESCQRMLESTTETADGLLRLEQITQLRLKNEALEFRLEEERKKQAELEVKLAARDRDCRKGLRGGADFSFPQYPPQLEQVVVLLKPYFLHVYPYLTKGVNILKALQVELQIFLAGIPSVKANSMILSKVIVYGAATSLVLFVFLFLYAICFGGGQKSQKKKGE